ncbi:HAMP domain-containing sensor histidine kinase [Balneolales bacterium ANBcel1]|nr:HAMP domain-containing sensor histidine kinase [Balneolales bacterium ANBcel1]
MLFRSNSNRIKGTLIFLLVIIAIGSFTYTQYLVEKIREKERSGVELWARAMEYNSKSHFPDTREELERVIREITGTSLVTNRDRDRWISAIRRAESDLSNSHLDFVATELIIKNRFEIPSVVVDEDLEILHSRNTGNRELDQEIVAEYASINEPIRIELEAGNAIQEQFVYYGDSGLIRTLRYFPYVQFGLLALFLGMGYLSLSSIKRTEQSNLWVGMAREAAHQLGTPLSSLYGWVALLRESNNDQQTLHIAHEISSDLQRMQIVADRFNKIGSVPELKPKRPGPVIRHVMEYLEKRLPQLGKQVTLSANITSDKKIPMSQELFAWALENLMKNALDAIDKSRDNARVHVETHEHNGFLIIDVTDTGKGIRKQVRSEIFNPGYSTKKRGWGLGLSLTRRIIEDYHQGKIFVHKSVPGEGTTIRLMMPVSTNNGHKGQNKRPWAGKMETATEAENEN